MAKKISEINWSKLLKVDSANFSSWFNLADERIIGGANIKFYGLKFKNDKPDYKGFIEYLFSQTEKYVFDEKEIIEIKEDGDSPQEKALSYFGDTDPIRDGRYGEMILYMFVEGILKAPLIVHKISQTYNDNDQVKGSDGLFIGIKEGKSTLFIGESKMKGVFSSCVSEALDSISRFVNNPSAIDRELSVAKKHLSRDLDNLDEEGLNLIYNSLRTKQPEFNQYQICYPAFLMYREGKLNRMIEQNLPDIETEINNFIVKLRSRRDKYIEQALQDNCGDISIEFFMIPVIDVNTFRKLCYKIFHNGKDYKDCT